MKQDCSKYLHPGRIASALQYDDKSLQKKILGCLENMYKESFLKEIVIPFSITSQDAILPEAEESYNRAVPAFFKELKSGTIIPGYNNIAGSLLDLFKRMYHMQLCTKLQLPDITDQVHAILLQMNVYYRDFLIWHYIDNFSVDEMMVITGKTRDSVKKELWNSRENFTIRLSKVSGFSTVEIITEQQFYLFLNYFMNRMATEGEPSAGNHIDIRDHAVLKNFELELQLRYNLNRSDLQKNFVNTVNQPFSSADDYIDHVKQAILDGKKQIYKDKKNHNDKTNVQRDV